MSDSPPSAVYNSKRSCADGPPAASVWSGLCDQDVEAAHQSEEAAVKVAQVLVQAAHRVWWPAAVGMQSVDWGSELVHRVWRGFMASRIGTVAALRAYFKEAAHSIKVDWFRRSTLRGNMESLTDPETGAERDTLARQDGPSAEFRDCLRELGRERALLVIERYVLGARVCELAAELRVRERTVARRLASALGQLRRCLQSKGMGYA